MIRYTIRDEITKKIRTQGMELTQADIGRQLGEGFGHVVAGDVGKRVWVKSFGLSMENDAQRDARKAAV